MSDVSGALSTAAVPTAVPQDIISDLTRSFIQTIAETVWNAVVRDLLSATFGVFDKYGSPDVLPNGPLLSGVLPITLWLGLFVALVMSLVQIGRGVIRGGRGVGDLLIGVAQYALITAGALTSLNILIDASNALALGILKSGLSVDSWAGMAGKFGFANQVVNGISPLLLIIFTLLLYLPAALFLLFEVLFRYAALAVLAATTPILAAGLVSEFTRRWFYTGLRWVIALLLMEPAIALVLVIGYRGAVGAAGGNGVSDGAISSIVGLVVFSVMIIISLVCPIALFKLLAFMDPNTMSGTRVRNVLGGVGRHEGAGSSPRGAGSHDSRRGSGAHEPGSGGGSDGMDATGTAASSRLSAAMASIGSVVEPAGRAASAVIGAGGAAAEQASRSFDAWGVGHPGAVNNQAHPAQASGTGRQQADGEGAGGGSPGGPSQGGPSPQGPGPSSTPSPAPGGSGPPWLPSGEVVQGEVLDSGPGSPLALTSTRASPGMGGDAGGGWPTQVRMPTSPPASPTTSEPGRSAAGSRAAVGGEVGGGAAAGVSGAEAMEMAVVLL